MIEFLRQDGLDVARFSDDNAILMTDQIMTAYSKYVKAESLYSSKTIERIDTAGYLIAQLLKRNHSDSNREQQYVSHPVITPLRAGLITYDIRPDVLTPFLPKEAIEQHELIQSRFLEAS